MSRLQPKQGMADCTDGEESPYMFVPELEEIAYERFGSHEDYSKTLPQAMSRLKTHPDIEARPDKSIRSLVPSHTLGCMGYLMWRAHQAKIILIGCLLAVTLFLYFRITRELRARNTAKRMYELLERFVRRDRHINYTEKLLQKTLVKEYPSPDSEVAALWPRIKNYAFNKKAIDDVRRHIDGVDQSCWVYCD